MAAEESELAVPSLSLRDFIQVLRRRKTIALITFATVFALVCLATLMAKPQYRSVARVMLEDQNKGARGSMNELGELFAPQEGMAVESQVQLIASPLILDRVYEQTKISPGSVQVAVERMDRTNIISISGVSNSRENVQAFVSEIPKVYQENRRMESARAVTSQLNFAIEELKRENQKLLDTEAALAKFKNQNNLIDPDSEVAAALNDAAQSRAALQQSRADVSSLSAQIEALQNTMATLPSTVNAPVVATNPVLQDLKNQLSALQSERKDKKFLYTDQADPIRQIDLQIANLKSRIANTPPTITTNSRTTNPAVAQMRERIAGLRADYSAKVANSKVLEEQTAKLESGLGRYTEIQQQLQVLQRQREASLQTVKEGGEEVSKLRQRASALQQAGAPVTVMQEGSNGVKIAPNPPRQLLVGLFVAVLLACGAAMLQDSLDDRVRDDDEARRILGAPVLGYFPLLPVSDERQILDVNNPDRLLLEMFRSLRSNVQFALVNSAGKKLQITSTVPNEGKSYITSNLAIAMAMDGRRVIIVDSDLHRPTMHERFGASRQPGLTNVLVGEAKAKEALQDVGINGLQLLSAGALPPNPAELLNSPAMVEVMKELEEMADLIIFDTPPLLATSDSQLISSKMDGVVFVMQMGSVARSGTLRAFELLKQANANLIGIVFNKANATQGSPYYEYYNSGYYALESQVADDEVLVVPAKKLSGASDDSSSENSKNGVPSPGVSKGEHANGSNGQATVFDEAIQSDDNSR